MKRQFWCLGAALITTLSCLATNKLNHLTKVYEHKGTITDNIVCYFTEDPVCNKLPNKPRDSVTKQQETMIFFLPMTSVEGSEAKSMVKKLHATKKNGYTIAIQEVMTPIKGIKVTIVYDPNKIFCDYQMFNAITGNKGLVFSFHNKEVLTKLKVSTDPLMQYAMNMKDHAKKPKIMLDIGHGGSDEGKVGCFHVQEKVVNLQVGTKIAKLLKNAGYEVFLTRENDSFVALDERTSLANKKKVDLFLSIHANAGGTNAAGIETYWLDSKLLKKNCLTYDENLQKLVVMRDTLSCLFAHHIHTSALDAARKVYDVNDRKVKTSVAQVLLGTDMMIPSALIEIGFLSNLKETKFLMDAHYQSELAQGIAHGVISYLKRCADFKPA